MTANQNSFTNQTVFKFKILASIIHLLAGNNSLKPLTDYLAYNGYSLVTKTVREYTDPSGKRRVKGNMDVELAVDMLELAPHIEHAVLFSGDADFRREKRRLCADC